VFGGLDIGFGFQYVRMINKTISVDVVGSIGENFFFGCRLLCNRTIKLREKVQPPITGK